jgi:hypothetical protein
MDHTDWIGIGQTIGILATAIVSVLGAIQSLRNGKQIEGVHELVNSLNAKMTKDARAQGVRAGAAGEKPPSEVSNVPPEQRPAV